MVVRTLFFGAKRSNQWTQYAVVAVLQWTQWNNVILVGTLSLVQKGQTSRFSGCSHTVDAVTQWTQFMQYTVDAVHSAIVVYDGGDIVFGAKRSNQWMQYTVDAVHSGIVVYGGGDIVFGVKRSNQ